MKKLKLNLDELKVESFETTSTNHKRTGTVEGYVTPWTDMCMYTAKCASAGETCDPSCVDFCTYGPCA